MMIASKKVIFNQIRPDCQKILIFKKVLNPKAVPSALSAKSSKT